MLLLGTSIPLEFPPRSGGLWCGLFSPDHQEKHLIAFCLKSSHVHICSTPIFKRALSSSEHVRWTLTPLRACPALPYPTLAARGQDKRTPTYPTLAAWKSLLLLFDDDVASVTPPESCPYLPYPACWPVGNRPLPGKEPGTCYEPATLHAASCSTSSP